jgi:hypothetical protein
LSGLYSLAVLIPCVAVAVRRLHDTNRSGRCFLVVFVPLIGTVVLLAFCAQDSQPGENRYGPNPKAVPVESVLRQSLRPDELVSPAADPALPSVENGCTSNRGAQDSPTRAELSLLVHAKQASVLRPKGNDVIFRTVALGPGANRHFNCYTFENVIGVIYCVEADLVWVALPFPAREIESQDVPK